MHDCSTFYVIIQYSMNKIFYLYPLKGFHKTLFSLKMKYFFRFRVNRNGNYVFVIINIFLFYLQNPILGRVGNYE